MRRLGQPDYRRLGLGGPPWGLGPLSLKYARKVLSVERASLISDLPLWEQAGSVARDFTGNGRNGASVGVTLGEPGIGDGRTSYGFDGANDYVNWYSAGLAAAFNGAEGTLGPMWFKMPAAAWTDGLVRASNIGADGTNYVRLQKAAANGTVAFIYSAGTIQSRTKSGLSTTDWFSMTITWKKSDDEVKPYWNGVQEGATLNGLGIWAGAPAATRCVIGAALTTPTFPFLGNIQHVPLRNKALTPAQVAYLSKP